MKRLRILCAFSTLAVALTVLGSLGQAQDKAGPGEPAVAGPATKALAALNGAFKLVDYGRENKLPEALILAARIIGTTEIQKPDPKQDESPKSDEPQFDAAKHASGLIDEALKMESAKSEAIKLLAEKTRKDLADVEQKRGRLEGPKAFPGRMRNSDDFDVFRTVFRGKQPAEIIVRVEPKMADVDLRVVDEQTGQVVAHDRRADDDCYVRWYPNATKKYLIELRNYRRNINVQYTLYMN